MKKIGVLFTTLFLLAPAGYLNPSLAESGVTLEPSFLEIEMAPSEKATLSFNITNHDEEKMSISSSFMNGVVKDDGTIGISTSEDLFPAIWLKSLNTETVEIKKNSTEKLSFELNIPDNTPSKTYYPLIVFDLNTQGGEGIGATGRIAATIYLNVKNPNDQGLVEKLEIENFKLENSFSFVPEVNIRMDIKNTGNVYTKPVGYIEVFDPNGIRQENVITLNEEFKPLFPNQSQSLNLDWIDNTIKEKLLPPVGFYVINTNLKTQNEDEFEVQEDKFFVLPIQYVIYTLLGGGLVFAAINNVKKLKKNRSK